MDGDAGAGEGDDDRAAGEGGDDRGVYVTW